jgi:exonuclease III
MAGSIVSWNVNGIRAVHQKGFLQYMMEEGADIVCLQETKARPDQLSGELLSSGRAGRDGLFSRFRLHRYLPDVQRGRERNIGWRLDYFCVNGGFSGRVLASEIRSEVTGSDHCPVVLNLENG